MSLSEKKYTERWCDIELFSYTSISEPRSYIDLLTFYGVEWKNIDMQKYNGVDIDYNSRSGEIFIYSTPHKRITVKDIILKQIEDGKL